MRLRWSVLAGLMLALLSVGGAVAAGAPWTAPQRIDTRAPFAHPAGIIRIACPGAHFCIAVGELGLVATSRDPAGGTEAWRSSLGIAGGADLSDVACPQASVCFALRDGLLLGSRGPSGGPSAWRSLNVAGRAITTGEMACASASVCVAVDGEPRASIATVSDASGGGSWHESTTGLAFGLGARLACPAASLCLAVDDEGRAIVSHDPAAGAGSWRSAGRLPGAPVLQSLACASASLCLGVDVNGRLYTSTNADGTNPSWKVDRFPDANQVLSLTCGGPSLCLAFDDYGNVLATTSPAGGAATWRRSASNVGTVGTCVSSALCVAGDGQGHVAVSSDPGAMPASWISTSQLAGLNPLGSLACPALRLCLGVDSGSHVVSTEPRTGSAWGGAYLRGTSDTEPDRRLDILSCASVRFCAVIGATAIATSTRPAGGRGAWRITPIPAQPDSHEGNLIMPSGLACTGRSFCAASFGSVILLSRRPAGGAGAWRSFRSPDEDDSFSSISCPSSRFCLAGNARVGGGSHVVLSYDPARPRAWHFGSVRGAGVSCLPVAICVTVDPAGEIFASRHATIGQAGWSRVVVRYAELTSVACASVRLCIALPRAGSSVFVSRNPFAPRPTWRRQRVVRESGVAGNGPLEGIACAPDGPCIAGDVRGQVIFGPVR